MSNRRFAVSLAGVLLVLAQACAPLAPPPKVRMREVKFALRDFNLPNGLRIVVEEDHSAPVVGVVAVVGSGASSDPRGAEGLAHLVEHLTFRSKPDGHTSLWTLLAYAGAGDVNAVTGLDDTVFYAFGPSNALPALLKLEGLRLTQPLEGIDAATFGVEREVVHNELRSLTEHGNLSAPFSALQQALYPPDHPYAHALDGTEATLDRLTLEAARAFVAQHYVPSNLTLLISGDVAGEQIGELLNQTLPGALTTGAALAAGPRMAATPPEPPEPPPGTIRRLSGRVAFPELLLGWSVPRGFDDASAVQSFVVSALNDQLSGASRDRDILGVHAELVPGKEGSMIVVRAMTRGGRPPEKAEEWLLDQAFRVWQPFNDLGNVAGAQNAFSRMRAAAVVERALDSEGIEFRALTRAESTHFTRDPHTFSRSLQALSRVELAQVGAFAFKYLNRARARSVYVTPLAKGELPPSANTGVANEAPETPAQVSFPSSALRSVMTAPGFSAFKTATLGNGLEVIVGRRASMPVVTLSLAMPGGEAAAEKAGAATLARYLSHQSDHVQGAPEDFGASMTTRSGQDTLWLEERASSGNLENALAVMRDRVISMHLMESSLAYFHEIFDPIQKRQDQEPESRAERTLREALYGGTPYGRVPTSETFAAVKEADIVQVLGETYVPDHAVLAIVGDLDPDKTVELVSHWLGDWRRPLILNGDTTVHDRKVMPERLTADATRVRVESLEGASQVELHFACALPPGGAKQELSDEVLAQVLEHELERRARQEQGATYGVSTRLEPQRGGASLLRLTTRIERDQLSRVLGEFQSEWQDLVAKGPSPEALARGRWDHARTFNVDHVTSRELARRAVTLRIQGRTLESEDVAPQLLTTVSASDVRQQARSCQEDSALVLVGDRAVIDAALKSVGGSWQASAGASR